MILRHRCAIFGAELDEVDPRIVINSIDINAGKDTINGVSYGKRDGQRVTGTRRDSVDIVVGFSLRIKPNDMQGRAELLELVNSWARPGWLTINYKPNRRIYVRVAQKPGEGDAANWTNNYQITFRSYGVPYWEESEPSALLTATGNYTGGTITVGGNEKTSADVSMVNTSSSVITWVSATVAGRVMRYEGLDLAPNETFIIDHDPEGRVFARIRTPGGVYRSVYDKRTETSYGDLVCEPGNAAVLIEAQRAVRATVTARGRFA